VESRAGDVAEDVDDDLLQFGREFDSLFSGVLDAFGHAVPFVDGALVP